MDIIIEYNLDQIVIARDGFKLLDLLSDVGGMQSILISIVGYILAIVNYNLLDNFMVSRLYKIAKPKAELRRNSNLEFKTRDHTPDFMVYGKC